MKWTALRYFFGLRQSFAHGARNRDLYSYTLSCNNLRPFLKCDFSDVPESRLNVFFKDWPLEKAKSLAAKESSERSESLPQFLDARVPVEGGAFTDPVSALQIEASPKPDNSLSFAERRVGMEMKIEKAFFNEARSHIRGEKWCRK